MTRITNLGWKKEYLTAGFTKSGPSTGSNSVQPTIAIRDTGSERPKQARPARPNAAKDNHRRAESSEKRRLKRANERDASRGVCYSCRQEGHRAQDCPTAPQAPGKRNGKLGPGAICYRCGSTDHRLSACKRPVDPDNPLPYAACFVCSETGHLAGACPKNEKGVYPMGGCCRLCGEKSHLVKDCPVRQGEQDEGSPGQHPGDPAAPGADEDDFHVSERKRPHIVDEGASSKGQSARKRVSAPITQPPKKKAKVVAF